MEKTTRNRTEEQPTVALIGCGAIAQTFYLPALTRYASHMHRLILVDNDMERAKRTAEQFGAQEYLTDYREITGSVDGVIIAVPHHLHFPISRHFLTAGVHVLCEKPLAETGVEVQEMIRLAEQQRVSVSVNNTRRLFPTSIKVKELLSDGAIGRPLSIRYLDGGEFNWPTASGFYFNSKVSGKGVLLDIGAHVLDLLCWWLGGKPDLVSSENDSFGGCEAVAGVLLEYRGCMAEVRLSRLSKLPNYFRIAGELGSIEGDVYDWSSVRLSSRGAGTRTIKTPAREKSLPDFGLTMIENFLGVLRGGQEPLIPAREVLGSIQLLEEAYAGAVRFSLPWYEMSGVPGEH